MALYVIGSFFPALAARDRVKSIISGFVLTEDFLFCGNYVALLIHGPCIYTGPSSFSSYANSMDSYVTSCIPFLHCVFCILNALYGHLY
jgi:hypothetical protein